MLGWEIFIHRSIPGEDPPAPRSASLLASWTTGVGGTQWLDDLAARGEIEDLGGNGYPIRYRGPARVFMPHLESGPPPHRGPLTLGDDYIHPPGWSERHRINHALISRCSPDEVWLVEAWDQS